MKRIGTFGLIAVAMVALIAAFGAISASAATTLCKENIEPCPESSRYPAATVIEGEATNPIFLGVAEPKCTSSTMTGETSEQAGSPLKVKITSLKFSGCSGCKSVAGSGLPWKASVEATSGGNGSFSTPGQFAFSECFGGATCKFGSEQIKGEVLGGSPAYISVSSAELSFEGGSESLCGKTAKLSVKYTIKKPTPLFVRTNSIPSVVCGKNVAACPKADTYAAGTSITAAGKNFAFEGTIGGKCTGATLGGKLSSPSGLGAPAEITSLAFSGCTPCTKVEALNLPYQAEFNRTSGGNGTLTVKSGGSGKPALLFTSCAWGSNCKFGATEMVWTVEGGNPAKLVGKVKMTREETPEFFCGNSVTAHGTYEFSNPAPLFVTAGE